MDNQQIDNVGTAIISTFLAMFAVTLIFSSPYIIWTAVQLATLA